MVYVTFGDVLAVHVTCIDVDDRAVAARLVGATGRCAKEAPATVISAMTAGSVSLMFVSP